MLAAAQAVLFGRLVGTDTDYDEGVYLTSVEALEHGQRLGEDVFAPQPPVFYLLLRLVSFFGADSVRGFHWGMVVLSVLTCLAAYALARSLAGPVAGLAASALLSIAPPFPLFAHRVLADIPPLGLALAALWLAWEASKRGSLYIAGAAGITLALAVATKPNAVLTLVPFTLLLLWRPAWRSGRLAAAVAGAALTGGLLALAYRGVLGELWESVVVYHRDARSTPDVIDKQHELVTFLDFRTPFAWLTVAGVLAAVLLLRRRGLSPVWALWLWAALSLAFLVLHHPLHYNHLLVLPVVLAVPSAVGFVQWAEQQGFRDVALGVLALLLVVGYVQQHRRVAEDDVPEEPALVAAAALLRERTEPGDLVVSDHPIVAYLAGRQVVAPLVDTATLRFETGSLTDEEFLSEVEQADARAVVAGRALQARPAILRGLRELFGPPVSATGIDIYDR